MQQTLKERTRAQACPPVVPTLSPRPSSQLALQYANYDEFQHSYYNLRYGLIAAILSNQII